MTFLKRLWLKYRLWRLECMIAEYFERKDMRVAAVFVEHDRLYMQLNSVDAK